MTLLILFFPDLVVCFVTLWENLYRYPPKYGPEWGSGGIFGLRYHKNVLYYTVAFDAEAHFHHEGEERIYQFDKVGNLPTSGGDTYNAVATVDDSIYFGGWVHAPAIYKEEDSTIRFVNKYSHVHEYDTKNDEIRLLWTDSIHAEKKWTGEVSDILYDPYNDRLLLAREDGDENLGIYALDRDRGEIELLNDSPSPKGALVHDTMFFGVGENFELTGLKAIHALNLITEEWREFSLGLSIDGGEYLLPYIGEVASIYNRVMAFVRGGIFAGNPLDEEEIRFARLFDFSTLYSPMRNNALPIGGGLLIAYNSMHDQVYQPKGTLENEFKEFTNTVIGPSVLLYITPPMVKIVGVFGTRITSIEKMGGKILLGTNTTPNVSRATPFDTGQRGITVLDESTLQRSPPPVTFSLPLKYPTKAMNEFNAGTFGGIPITGYSNPRMIIYASKRNTLQINEYDLALPLFKAHNEEVTLEKGKNLIDLSRYSGILSFKLEKGDEDGKARIELR